MAEAEAEAGRGVVGVRSARPRRFERTPTMTKAQTPRIVPNPEDPKFFCRRRGPRFQTTF
jgi:hypothetical protein